MRRATLALACTATLGPFAARAASPEAVPVSPEAALTAGAVLASDDVGGGGWYNPASLGAVKRSSVQVGASAYAESATIITDAAQAALPWGTISGDIRSLRYASVPSVLSYSFRLREGLGLSIGVWTPFHDYEGGTTTITSSGLYPSTPALNSTFAASYGLTERRDDTWGGVAIGWQATRRLRVGVMLQGVYATDVWSLDVNASLRTDSTDPSQSGFHLVYSERGDQGVIGVRSFLGMQWDATERVRLAAAVRGPGVRIAAWGPVDKFLSWAVLMPGVAPTQNLVAQQTTPGRGASVVEPVRLYGGMRYASGRWTLAAEGDWHPAFDGQFGDFREAWNARVGGTWRVDPDLLAGVGVFHDQASSEGTASRSSMRYSGFMGGVVARPSKVVKALGGSDAWDLLAGVAVRGAYGEGTYRGVYIAPIDPSISFPDKPARTFEGSISFFTTIAF
jgi:hypothetical protein